MKHRTVGSSGLRVSRLGLGTGEWGRGVDGDDAAAQVTAFVDAGGTLVDASASYGDGRALRVLAEIVDDVVPRGELVLSIDSGVSRPDTSGHWTVDCSRRALLADLDRTLRELGTDHLDLWSVGAWDPQTPLGEVAATLEHAVSSGRVRYAGVRGFTAWQLATVSASVDITAAQAEYSLLARGAEDELFPAADHHGVGVLAVSALAGGVLTGKYRDGVPADSRGADDHRRHALAPFLGEDGGKVVEAVLTAADGLGTSPLAVALAWARDRPGVASVVVGTRDIGQLTGVLAAEEVALPSAITSALDDVSS
ncbi:aldo/keto reductase [Rhodococcus sp. BP-332]|uniref:aldo/keto reductase n=1 Tax=Rhodococcus sp. BP-332 TaxID=2739447 RepID=UPI001C9ADB69|nr:aldo/keto reductase [Rhodococcus sp. BP-332]MBY6675466.1 aldo/keto reductase [Rhodococcus sp. BP-332]